jgi:hypothetical protein
MPQKSFICNYNPQVSKAFLAAAGNYRQYQGLRKMVETGLQILPSRFDSGRGLQTLLQRPSRRRFRPEDAHERFVFLNSFVTLS